MARTPRKPAPISAVAELAGVSVSTVSRVMNRNATVDPEIASRVRKAAVTLNYAPNPLARSLVLGKTTTVAILVPDLANPTFQSMMRGVSRAAAKDGYRILVADSGEIASEESILAIEMRRRCDAIVLCAPRMAEDLLADLLPALAPAVLINRDNAGTRTPVLTADYEAGVRPLAEHLYGLGHRRMAFLQGNPESASNAARLRGLAQFSATHPDTELTTIECGTAFESGHEAAAEIAGSGYTGILAFNDLVAMGLLSGLAELGVRVPEDISVTGFDDIPLARYTTPPLTTASVPVVELGEQAWLRLHALLREETPAFDVNYRPRLEVRGSTGPVASRR
ncbi:LacI family DNA-binding transcriptional regulator [Frondihabitans cladoniiphilus]|uniref:HTH lacI-type domain-containing protein n=1 Tax=Frondihabitans cladoniiphilus TaxID=715785 RepID=A0ABP8W6U4_9MICO